MNTIEKKITSITVICLLLNLLVFIFDLNNWGSRLLPVNHLNYDLLGIMVNTSTVITIAFLTYIVIDHRNIKKEENRKKTADEIIESAFSRCKTAVEYVDEYRESNPKIFDDDDFLGTIDPFDDSSMITTLSSEGVIESCDYIIYKEIKQLYQLLLFSYKKQFILGNRSIAKDPLHDKIINRIDEYNSHHRPANDVL